MNISLQLNISLAIGIDFIKVSYLLENPISLNHNKNSAGAKTGQKKVSLAAH